MCLLDEQRFWLHNRVGILPTFDTNKNIFCNYLILDSANTLVVPDVLQNAHFCDTPICSGLLPVRFYAGVTLRLKNRKLGTFCIIDSSPRQNFGESELQILKDIAGMVEDAMIAKVNFDFQSEQDAIYLPLCAAFCIQKPLKATNEVHRSLYQNWKSIFNNHDPKSCHNLLDDKQHALLKTEVRALEHQVRLLQADMRFSLGTLEGIMHRGITKYQRYCDILEVMNQAASISNSFNPTSNHHWTICHDEEIIYFNLQSLSHSLITAQVILHQRSTKSKYYVVYSYSNLLFLLMLSLMDISPQRNYANVDQVIHKIIPNISNLLRDESPIINKQTECLSPNSVCKLEQYPDLHNVTIEVRLNDKMRIDADTTKVILSLKYLIEEIGGKVFGEDHNLFNFIFFIPCLQPIDD